jgi:hypothetical protein
MFRVGNSVRFGNEPVAVNGDESGYGRGLGRDATARRKARKRLNKPLARSKRREGAAGRLSHESEDLPEPATAGRIEFRTPRRWPLAPKAGGRLFKAMGSRRRAG